MDHLVRAVEALPSPLHRWTARRSPPRYWHHHQSRCSHRQIAYYTIVCFAARPSTALGWAALACLDRQPPPSAASIDSTGQLAAAAVRTTIPWRAVAALNAVVAVDY